LNSVAGANQERTIFQQQIARLKERENCHAVVRPLPASQIVMHDKVCQSIKKERAFLRNPEASTEDLSVPCV
jgi:hypothetical protein